MEESSADQERQRQLFSVRYYLHDVFRVVSEEWLRRTNGVTNYAALVDQIRHLNTTDEPVCLSCRKSYPFGAQRRLPLPAPKGIYVSASDATISVRIQV